MQRIVFYSWQSDLPNATNRGLIQDALQAAATSIAADKSIEIEPVVDRDTQGVPGSPDIASTIFAKITAADVFVADVSIVARSKGKRAFPNPNVLVELGYAYKALGHERIILVFNSSFGKITELPFDLRMRRVLSYNMIEESTDRSSERKRLQDQFDRAIREAMGHVPTTKPEVSIPALRAIEEFQPGRALVVRRNLEKILKNLIAAEPPNYSAGGRVPQTEEALKLTQEAIAEFSKIAEAAAIVDDEVTALEILRAFSTIFERYQDAEGFSGRSSNADHDYYRFLGYEMMLVFIAAFLREQRWKILNRIFEEPILLRYTSETGGSQNVTWSYAYQALPSFVDESRARQRKSLQADILKTRHDPAGGLGAVAPFDDLAAAEILLYLRTRLASQEISRYAHWYPHTSVYDVKDPPFLINAEFKTIAQNVAKLLQIETVDDLKQKLTEAAKDYSQMFFMKWRGALSEHVIQKIGTR